MPGDFPLSKTPIPEFGSVNKKYALGLQDKHFKIWQIRQP
jgi:hypothetical protein